MVGFCERNLTAYDRPSHVEIIVPPLFLAVTIVLGLFTLMLYEKRKAKKVMKRRYTGGRAKVLADDYTVKEEKDVVESILGDGTFLSEFDHEVLREMETYYNQPRQLVRICVPAFVSLIITALVMFLFQPLVDCLWPNMIGKPSSINTAVTCFLSPAGLVYALSFGFTFQQALEKNKSILNKVTEELSLMDQMLTMVTKLNLPSRGHIMAMCKAVKSEVIFMGLLVQDREPGAFAAKPPRNIKVHVWSILDILRNASEHKEYKFNVNTIVVDKIVSYLLKLNSICTDRMGSLHARIHPLMWFFLEVLGSLVLLGVLLIDAKSRRMELAMCELTIFSVSMLCYVLADLDSPFNGFFRVDLSILPEVIKRIEFIYNQARTAGSMSVMEHAGAEAALDDEKTLRDMMLRKRSKEAEMNPHQPNNQPPIATQMKMLDKASSNLGMQKDDKDRDAPIASPAAPQAPKGCGAHGTVYTAHSADRISTTSMETSLTDID